MPGVVDVVLVAIWADRKPDLYCIECMSAEDVPSAEELARDIGAAEEGRGALCLLKLVPGGFLGAWGQGDSSARARFAHAR